MNRLRETRLSRNLNQRQLAEASHTAQATVSALERDVLKPWPKVAERLSQALGVPAERIFPEDKERVALAGN
jgi:transcriptional regulator with XRE-family HTH domain